MATSTPVKTEQHGEHTTHPEGAVEEHHPSDKQYALIALFLGVVTAIEVGLYYVDTGVLNTPLLLLLAAVKFVVVIGWFMHLKFDNPVVRRLFVMGLVLAVAVYLAALATFGVFLWDRNEVQPETGDEEAITLVRS